MAKAKEVTQAEDLKTVTVKSAEENKTGLWDRSPAYKDVKGAVRMGDGDEETYEIFIRNEPTSVPKTGEVAKALANGNLIEVNSRGEAKE